MTQGEISTQGSDTASIVYPRARPNRPCCTNNGIPRTLDGGHVPGAAEALYAPIIPGHRLDLDLADRMGGGHNGHRHNQHKNRFPYSVANLSLGGEEEQIMTVGYADGTLIGHALHSTRLGHLGLCCSRRNRRPAADV